MSVSDWIMIISIVFAVIAIYPSNERNLIAKKLCKYEPTILVLSLLFVLYLIKFDEITSFFHPLKSFYTEWGLKANNLALILFLILVGYIFWRIFIMLPNLTPREKLMVYYLKLMKTDFDGFFRLFTKYEKKASQYENFKAYERIIFDSQFVSEMSNRNPYFFLQLLQRMDNTTFKPFFTHILNDPDSVFYKELKRNNNFDLVEPTNDFLFELLHINPKLFIDIGGLMILRDWYLLHLQTEKLKGSVSIYNQTPELLIDEYEFLLPLYYHISFIGLLYNEAIIGKVDISTISTKYTNMQSIFSTMIEKMIENIDKTKYGSNIIKEYPTSYHYIISEIFNIIGHWLDSFNEDENYDSKSSLIVFFPFCFSLCLNQLYKGLQDEKINIDFIKKRFCYDLFHIYFGHNLKKELENEINERCIKDIPKHLIETIFDYVLDDKLAINFHTFIKGDFTFPASKDFEQERLQSLKTFLSNNNLI
jgi:hypothetical protein